MTPLGVRTDTEVSQSVSKSIVKVPIKTFKLILNMAIFAG